MQKLLLISLLFFSQIAFSQRGFLYVKKKSFKKVMTFAEGSVIKFQTKDQQLVNGVLVLVKKDSIYINNTWFAILNIEKIILRDRSFHFAKTFLLTTVGVALSTAGMTLAKWDSFERAMAFSAGVGYGNLLIRHFPKLKRKKYEMGKKFMLHTLDLHF